MKTKDFLGCEWDIECMGCAISDGSMLVPGDFIKKAKYFFVHQDPLIPLPGFLVIASRRHYQSITDMQEAEYNEFSALVRDARSAIKEAIDVEYITIVQEESSIHFHLWFFPWSQSLIEKYGKPSLSKIREIMSDFKTQPIGEVEWKELAESIAKLRLYWRED
jgi:diadenosine tetraphosphate (Ap4A) HIT family hydrolase